MTKCFRFALAIAVIWVFGSLSTVAQTPKQEERPRGPLSPTQNIKGTIGGKSILITYDAPSMRGREIFGKLVPYGRVWCPGANWATTITSNDAGIQIGTLKLPKGVYAIWIIPNKDQFELVVNSDAKAFHLDYKAEKDLGRMKMSLKQLDQPVEQLRFEVRPGSGNQGTLAFQWEKTEATVPLTLLP